jgi:hypothetical protein
MREDGRLDQRVQVSDGVAHAVDERPRALGAAVTAMVQCVHGVAIGHQAAGYVVVATTVLRDPVN